MPELIKVGFIGLSATGWGAQYNGPALLDPSLKDRLKLTAVSTTSPETAAASAKMYGEKAGNEVKAYHGSSARITADPDVDLVVVSVKTLLHKEVSIPVFETGLKKRVFLEWPIGRGMSETLDVANAAKKHGFTPIVGLQARCSGVVQKIKSLLDSGVIGRVISSRFIFVVPREARIWTPYANVDNGRRYSLEKKNGATPLMIAGGHQLDAFMFALGQFTSISASAAQIHPTLTLCNSTGTPTGETMASQFYDHYTFSGVLSSGVHATFILQMGVSSVPGRKTLDWVIEGDKGMIQALSETTFGGCINLASPNLYLNGEEVKVDGVKAGEWDAVGILVSQWAEVAKGSSGSCATIGDAIRLKEILEAVERSVDEGRTIKINA
ncbi:hypothetical protein CVT24_010296 [Panaeolus cyanescens]|uniref:Uncharacterized protein n=1 Tax=Panaeolus cyanescens TaxID=181874 RepID=A0A409YQC2_9AGAR|nr:hypothetical protein CVT24_010296 [Panaeolus cyanescens]